MFQSIRLQVILFFFVTTAVSIICSGSYLSWKQYTAELSQNRASQYEVMHKLSISMTEYLKQLGGDLQLIADLAALQRMNRAEQYILLKSLQIQREIFKDIIFVSTSHDVVHSHIDPEREADDLFPSPKEILQLAGESNETRYLLRQYQDSQPYILVIAPVLLINKSFLNGAVAALLPLKELENAMDETLLGFSGQVALYLESGKLLTSLSSNFPFKLLPPPCFEKDGDIHSSIQGNFIYGKSTISLSDPDIVILEGHEFNPWKPVLMDIRMILFLLLVIFLVILTAGWRFVSRILTKPLALLEEGTEQIQLGNYNHQIKLKGRNEFSNLATAFNTMSKQLTKTFQELDSSIGDLHQEIEKRQQINMQLQHADKLASLGRLAASIAHEFGNPILGLNYLFKELMTESKLTEKHSLMVGLGIDECKRMQDLIKNLRQLSRPSTMTQKSVIPSNLVQNSLLFHKKSFSNKKITLKKSLDNNLPSINVIEDQITQVFFNLINNAVDAMAETGGILTVSTYKTERDVIISFKDSGPGMSKEHQNHVFEPFFSTKPEMEGTGLGLYISYNIIKNHGGNIEVSAVSGQGSTFIVSIPIKTSIPEPLHDDSEKMTGKKE